MSMLSMYQNNRGRRRVDDDESIAFEIRFWTESNFLNERNLDRSVIAAVEHLFSVFSRIVKRAGTSGFRPGFSGPPIWSLTNLRRE